ncbi:MAG: hypothetical protein IJ041_06225 [Clostridia bacterium]|nr:hypothetical protein [Clostridia bacterium]
MPTITDKIKTTWFKCMESLGQGAANLADNAKQKLAEINMEARRKEVVADLPTKLMQMWKDGAELPEELNELLGELNTIDEELAAARAARLAKKTKPAITDGSDAAEAAPETVEEAEAAAEEAMDEAKDAVEDKMEDTEESIGDVFRSIFKPEEAAQDAAEEAAEATEEKTEAQYDYN